MNKDQAKLVKAAEKAGWRVDHSKRHVTIYPPDRNLSPIPVASSGKGRGNKNLRGHLRHAGLNV